MTVFELMTFLRDCPPMNEVYVQTSYTTLQKVHSVAVDKRNGFVELKWREKDNGLKTTNWILEERKEASLPVPPDKWETPLG